MRGLLAQFALTALIVGAGCRPAAPSRSSSTDRPNVLLVTIDTLRADHVGCYGIQAASTPTIDALAATRRALRDGGGHAPLTGPSHATILTGLIPLGHGFRNNSGFTMSPQVRTAAEDFRQAGYRTAAFVSGFPLDRRFGFDRGFDTYDDHLPEGNDPAPDAVRGAIRGCDHRRRASLAGRQPARTGPASPWFLWVHYYDPHAPYEPPADLAERYRQSPYDGEIAFVDRSLTRLLHALEVAGRHGANARRSSPPIMARAWVSTARARTASSCTTPRSGCRG